MNTIYQALSELAKNNESAALCTVVKSEGSTPRHVGSKMLVYPDSRFIGTVGGGELESRVIKAAIESLRCVGGPTPPTGISAGRVGGGARVLCTVEVFVEP